jgi:hypothetical protein
MRAFPPLCHRQADGLIGGLLINAGTLSITTMNTREFMIEHRAHLQHGPAQPVDVYLPP